MNIYRKIENHKKLENLKKDELSQAAVSFEKLLDDTCVKLQKQSASYVLKKLDELDAILRSIENDLDRLANGTKI